MFWKKCIWGIGTENKILDTYFICDILVPESPTFQITKNRKFTDMKKKIIIPATKNNPGTTARMFSLTEIGLHEFSDFILANKEIIIEKSIKLIF